MKKAIILFCLFFALKIFAQNSDPTTLSIQFQRTPCIQFSESTNTTSAKNGMHKTCLHQKDALIYGKGTPEIVVCLIDFEDQKFSVASTDDDLVTLFEQFFNGEDKGVGSNKRSVRGYFKAISNDQFTPHFNILRPVHLTQNKSDYESAYKFMSASLNAIDDQTKDNVSKYDNNKGEQDGIVDGAIIVYAGAGQNTVGSSGFLWPCTWSTTTYESTEGVRYRSPMICPELLQDGILNSMGVYAHEFSHALGLPDYYDTPNYKYPGMDYWSLMDAGEYTNNGYDPTPYTAYEKIYMGWMQPTELSEPTTITDMKSVANGGKAYIIYNDANHNEYYLLENRTLDDPLNTSLCALYGEGLMIYHVTEDANLWKNNEVNTTSTQHMTFIPANGHFEIKDKIEYYTDPETKKYTISPQYISEMRGHLWPLKNTKETVIKYYGLTGGNNCLTDDSERSETAESPAIDRVAPAARTNIANTDGTYLMHKSITDITQSEDYKTISFKFMGGANACAAPTISFNNGKIHFNCATEGAVFHYSIIPNVTNVSNIETNEDVDITAPKYTLKYYATANGYDQSETVTTIMNFEPGDVDYDGKLSVKDITTLVNKILKK